MASSIIHIAIAKKVLEDKSVDVENPKEYYLGSIAPDLSKQVGTSRSDSHFIINSKEDVPNTNIFIKRYPFFKYNSFDLGYFTHLYADKVWFDEFIPSIKENTSLKLLDGTVIKTTPEEFVELLYSDYTNLNIKVIEDHDLDLSLFYEEFEIPDTMIKEIPINKLDILINKMGIIIENSKEEKTYTIDMYIINEYIDRVAKEIIELLKKY